jgi:thioesterase domain-containing protein/acyl carrier protein
VLDELPLTANKKIDRKALPKPERAEVAVAAGTGKGPRDEVEAKIAAIFRNVLGLREVGVTESFFDLGGHSLLAVRLVAELERVFKRKVPLVELFSSRTVEQLSTVIRRDATAEETFRLVPIQPRGTKQPLFLMSRPNVNSLGYIALSRHLEPDRPIYGIQYQYAEETELGRPYTHEEYDAWARSYIETIRVIQPRGPYLLGGMCEGALIAFNMTRVLEAEGERVALLTLFDAWPQENTVRPLLHRVWMVDRKLRAVATLPPRERLQTAVSMLGRVGEKLVRRVVDPRKSTGQAAGAQPEVPNMGTDVWKARLYPGKDFVPPKVAAKITVFRLKRQPYWRVKDHEYGWGNRTTGGVEVKVVPGDDHRNFLREPEVATTGRLMRDCLSRADADGTAVANGNGSARTHTNGKGDARAHEVAGDGKAAPEARPAR